MIYGAYSCYREPSSGSLSGIDEAFAWIISLAHPVRGEETVPLALSLGRVAAHDIIATSPLPRFDHAAMDGFGLSDGDLGRPAPFDLPVVGRVLAGGVASSGLVTGGAVRLLTGAPVPAGVDAVIPEEACVSRGGNVRILKEIALGANIRRRGEDVSEGVAIVAGDTLIDARHMAILAASGVSSVRVRRRVRVALLSIGDELRPPATELAPGQIYDANRPMLTPLLAATADVVDLGLQKDHRRELADLLHGIAQEVDIIVSSAGVSGSDADHVAAAVGDAGGEARTFKVALKPGKPLLAGCVGSIPIIGLPGNPVAALVNFMLFARPLLNARNGIKAQRPRGQAAFVVEPIAHKQGRTEFVPARRTGHGRDGGAEVTALRPAGSARLHPLVLADGLIEIAPERGGVSAGETVEFHTFGTATST